MNLLSFHLLRRHLKRTIIASSLVQCVVKSQNWRRSISSAVAKPLIPSSPKLSFSPFLQPCRHLRRQRHKKMIKLAKGYRGRANRCFKIAKHRVTKARQYAYRDRKVKKRKMRQLWIIRINAGCRMYGVPYRLLIHYLNKQNIKLDRKVLADLAVSEPLSFKSIVELAKQSEQRKLQND